MVFPIYQKDSPFYQEPRNVRCHHTEDIFLFFSEIKENRDISRNDLCPIFTLKIIS